MCFITVTAATESVNVVYHGNERHGNRGKVTEGSPGKFRQVHNLKISDRLLRSKSFFKKIFLVLYAAYLVVREEGMGWDGKILMEE